MNKILIIDIGNTNIDLGLSFKSKIIDSTRIRSHDFKKIIPFLRKYKNIKQAYISSVVPDLTKRITGILVSGLKVTKVVEIGKDIAVPIKNKYRAPSSLGTDRLLNAFYIKEKIGYPAVSIDLGTALTLDLISDKAEFLGGIIFINRVDVYENKLMVFFLQILLLFVVSLPVFVQLERRERFFTSLLRTLKEKHAG